MIPKAILQSFGEGCRRLRLDRNETQAELAKRAKVGVATLHRFEQTGRINTAALARLLFALGRDEAAGELFKLVNTDAKSLSQLELAAAVRHRQRARAKKGVSDAR
jgi:transcriptional regulator with XRE-family HTH domain